MTTQENTKPKVCAQSGKYLTFRLGDEDYGLEILKVQEIIKMQSITKVPRSPEYVSGVINLRGKVIPVINLRSKFSMEKVDDSEKTCIIVVQIRSKENVLTTGVVVDEVSEVLDIREEEIEPAPAFGGDIEEAFILGMAKAKGSVKILLDIDKILSFQDVTQLQSVS